jgi:hypothetical protein
MDNLVNLRKGTTKDLTLLSKVDSAVRSCDYVRELIAECPTPRKEELAKLMAIQGYTLQQFMYSLLQEADSMQGSQRMSRILLANTLASTVIQSLAASSRLLSPSKAGRKGSVVPFTPVEVEPTETG